MSIGLEKLTETSESAEYAFVSDVYEPNPAHKGRSLCVGQNRGVLRIIKASGEIIRVHAMPEDDADKRYKRAAAKIRQHWEAGEYPERTMFACG